MAVSVCDTVDRFAPIDDRARRELVPGSDEFYGAAVAAIPLAADRPLRILDLGAGTRLLSRFLAERFRAARFVLMDASGAMLARARAALADEPGRIETRLAISPPRFPRGRSTPSSPHSRSPTSTTRPRERGVSEEHLAAWFARMRAWRAATRA
jgi:SAM-dependent methyltransferase